jgi:hypothetical protein
LARRVDDVDNRRHAMLEEVREQSYDTRNVLIRSSESKSVLAVVLFFGQRGKAHCLEALERGLRRGPELMVDLIDGPPSMWVAMQQQQDLELSH